ncbi:MAG: AarF/ABC1/UbiB kinase family protein [Nitrospirae bacterium]|nr:AarF/ABC1/UbiB kinase family protein [Candidatus Manganitrophaceae bacterium]
MTLSLKPQHLKRYKDIALLFFRYGKTEIFKNGAFDDLLDEEEQAPVVGNEPERLTDDLEEMGPTFIKIGQLLASRADLLPSAYLNALSRLHEDVKPFSYEEVEKIVQEELGVRISKGFSYFNPVPLAAASLGQVHLAALREGRPVVVKVQRPGIRAQILEDLEVLEEIAGFLQEHTEAGRRYQFLKLFDEMRKTLLRELDYQKEAMQLSALAEHLKEFERIQVPLPIDDYSTSRVLTMEYVSGKKITALGPLVGLEVDGAALADDLFHAYLKQILVDGLFHADPHPGNIYLTDDRRIALLDLGMVGRIAPPMQEHLLKLLIAIAEGNTETAADVLIRISEKRDSFQEAEFRRAISELIIEQKEAPLEEIDVGKAILGLVRQAAEHGLQVPPDLSLLGKTLLQLDQVGKTLYPTFNPTEAVRRHVNGILEQRSWKQLSPGQIWSSLLEMKDFVGNLPGRLNRILDALVHAELEFKIRPMETELYLAGFQKVANRITAGLILASLIVGAALLMRVETPFRILGYPGLAMLCFLGAAGGGFWLLINIFIQDHRDSAPRRRPL